MFTIFGLNLGWRDILDVAVVTFVLYRVILLVRGTRAVSVVYGLLLLVLAFFLSEAVGLYTLNWMLANFLGSIFLVIIILFQQDIRKALSQMGAGRLWRRSVVPEKALNELAAAMITLARKRIGALVVIEKGVPLGDVMDRGVMLNAILSADLLMTIFHPNTPLHDGAVIVKDDVIAAAACILPLATGIAHRSDLGTRHRAALGITEESDAVVVVVSEERGEVSIAVNGRLTTSLDEVRLKRVLRNALER